MRGAAARRHEAGFTLIELIISLALFALIAGAGVALVDGVLGIQSRTARRLERLGDLQRAMFVIGNDLAQAQGGPVGGTDRLLTISRPLAAIGGEPLPLSFALVGDALVRTPTIGGGQRLLGGVAAARWRFFRADTGWIARWPPDPRLKDERPAAIEIELALAPAPGEPGGTLRRIVALPVRP